MKKGNIVFVAGFLFLVSLIGFTASAASSYYSSYSSDLLWVPLVIFSIYAIIFIVWILVAVWVYKDAKKRKENAALWAIIVFIAGLIGILIWIALRPPIGGRQTPPERICPNCGRGIPLNAVFCPYCAKKFESYI